MWQSSWDTIMFKALSVFSKNIMDRLLLPTARERGSEIIKTGLPLMVSPVFLLCGGLHCCLTVTKNRLGMWNRTVRHVSIVGCNTELFFCICLECSCTQIYFVRIADGKKAFMTFFCCNHYFRCSRFLL